MRYKTLLGETNSKTVKGESLGYLTGIVYLAPANTVGGLNLCKFASKGCKEACLYTAGRGKFNNVQAARINKTKLFRDNLNYFMFSLVQDIKRLEKKAIKLGLKPAIRLNGTSDVRWETIRHGGKNIMELFPHIQFYDYTKDFKRFEGRLPSNYHLTFSVSEGNIFHARRLLEKGVNVAMVFFNKIPTKWMKFEVIDGDNHDLRFIDKRGGYIVGLIAKGAAKKDTSGFVRQSYENKAA